jgi:hypothetical protein
LTDKGNRANYDSEKSTVSLRQYFERLIIESDKRSEDRFNAVKESIAAAIAGLKEATSTALVASDKQTAAAFISAEKALAEAQTQLTAYKASANEWRATLNDLIATIMVRKEVEALFVAVNTKIDILSRTQNMMIGGILLLQVVVVIVLRFWK